jgi:benzoylformate decarboxylase
MRTVRDAAFDVLRRLGGTTLFCNPGSTEIPLLTDLPTDLDFKLALHEGSVVGMATGWALARDQPAVVILHTTAGLGNAVGALATARVNRAPLLVLVGQQDRRHLVFEPFLTGHRLDELAGDYPVWHGEPARAQDVPATLGRAWHEAVQHRGPAVVVVPMDDWSAPAEEDQELPVPARVLRATAVEPAIIADLVEVLSSARSPVLVVGSGTDDPASWKALQSLAERLDAPVWQEAFGGRAGFPQDHALFAGHLPAARTPLRKALAGYDLIVVVGAPVLRQYHYDVGWLTEPGVRVVLISEDPDEVNRSPVELAVLAQPAAACAALVDQLGPRATALRTEPLFSPIRPAPTTADATLEAAQVFAALAERLPRETVLVEESPSSRSALQDLVPARMPLGFLSAAMGGLGFGLPAAIGVRMARPGRPVVAVLGDGSSLYAIQALWSAAHYGVGVLVIVLANGRYAIMDQLAQEQSGPLTPLRSAAPWPAFDSVSISGLATAFGCASRVIATHPDLIAVFDEVLPSLVNRTEPLVLEVTVR